jgi:cell division GTPase FtsZ
MFAPVKPDGRALDIVVVGLGQAGGNLAAEFFRRGYRALALNTAQTDLSALDPGGLFPTLPAERRLYIGLDGYDGAGADPSYGRDCVIENADRIRAAVLKQAADADAVILTAGLGGGTGSSIPELVNVLKDEQLPLLALLTLPTESESGIAKVNAVRAINELVDAPLLGWIFVDNARIATLNPDVSIVDYYAHINGQIAQPIDALNRLNAREELKAIRSFDGEDFRKLLLSGGVLNYAVTELPGITTDEVVGAVNDSIEQSDLMPSGFDIAKLSYLGLIIEAPETSLASAAISTFEEMDEQLKAQTGGAAIYHGIYRTAPGQPTVLRILAATQSLPHRIREVLADAKREGQVLGEKIREELPTLELGEISGFELFRTNTRPSERPRRAQHRGQRRPADLVDDLASEIGSKRAPVEEPRTEHLSEPRGLRLGPPGKSAPAQVRGRPRRPGADEGRPAPTPPPPPRPGQGTPTPGRGGLKDLGTEEIDVVAELAELSRGDDGGDDELQETTPGVKKGPTSKASSSRPEDYDGLVAEYLQSKNARSRQEVVQRLERDSTNGDTMIRYYAVEAMAKLGRKVFGNALLAATEDEDEAVRQLAVEALRG